MPKGATSQKVCLCAAPLVEAAVLGVWPSKAAKRSAWVVVIADVLADDVVMEGCDEDGEGARG